KKIPPSLHFQEGNPNIRFNESPFYVNTRLKEWETGAKSKRTAAVSSFGLSGTNAHVVIEEAPETTPERNHQEKPGYLILLSACTSEQLRSQVEQLVAFCRDDSRVDLGNMSYTLLLGRKHLNHRLASVVSSRDELLQLLQKWLAKGKATQVYVSELSDKNHREQPSLKKYGNRCIRDCQTTTNTEEFLEHLSTIAELYIQGYELEYEGLFLNGGYARISLPTYPFSRERYWVPDTEMEPTAETAEPQEAVVIPAEYEATERLDSAHLEDRLVAVLKGAVSELLRVKVADIDENTELAEYGVDSIILTEFATQLSRDYSLELAAPIFFEYPTLRVFAHHLLEEYSSVFTAHFALQRTGGKRTPDRDGPLTTAGQQNRVPGKQRKGAFYSFAAKKTPLPPVQETPLHAQAENAPIAVVGMSGKFPMAGDVNEFWDILREGKNCITEIPAERWDWREIYGDPLKEAGKTNIKWGGFIEGVDAFDSLFFKISPAEAQQMDPRQRLLLTYTWKAIEDAGLTKEDLARETTGVFVAAGPGEYMEDFADRTPHTRGMTALAPSIIPNRISYVFNFNGPSEYFDTGCSSSLVALNRALQSIRLGECEQAVVAAVNLVLTPAGFLLEEAGDYLSPGGRARSFQAGADGYVRSEGVSVIIIKPLEKAVNNRDHIYALVKGTGVSHGGRGMSLTAPSAAGMKTAMVRAYQAAGIDPRTVSYIEAHGTASPLGDSIEINALKSGYRELAASHLQNLQNSQDSQDSQTLTPPTCYIGSLKPCIGHTETASGIAGLIKIILAMGHRLIPGLPGFTTLNENISLEGSPFHITGENREWETVRDADGKKLPRRASVNSYGVGGVNAHAVLEEYCPPAEGGNKTTPDQTQMVVFSAKNRDQLRAVVSQMSLYMKPSAARLAEMTGFSTANIAYTLQVGRQAMDYRMAMLVNDRNELSRGVEEYLDAGEKCNQQDTVIPIFTGDPQQQGIKKLLSGEIGEIVVTELLKRRDLEKLAIHWTRGGDIPWESFHEGEKPYRLSLPTYPFTGETFRHATPAKTWQRGTKPGHPGEDGRFEVDPGQSLQNNVKHYLITALSRELKIPADKIDPHKDLQDYGVDSIVTIKLLHGFREIFQVKVTARELLDYPTVETLTPFLADKADRESSDYTKEKNLSEYSSQKESAIRDKEPGDVREIKNVREMETAVKYPLSEGQKGLWILQKFFPAMSAYNVPIAMQTRQHIEAPLLEKTCRYMLERYPILGTVFGEENGEPYQAVSLPAELFFQKERLPGKEEDITALLREKAKEPFNLETGPLMRIHLFTRTPSGGEKISRKPMGDLPDETPGASDSTAVGGDIVLVTLHHIIFDGTSALMFIDSLWDTYHQYRRGIEPGHISTQATYFDFVKWEQDMLAANEGREHLAYWKKQLAGELPVLALPTDYPPPPQRRFKGKTCAATLEPQVTRQIREAAKKRRLNVSIMLLGILKVLIYRYTGQEDIITGMPTIGRPQRRFDDVMGYFINMMAVRSRLKGGQIFMPECEDHHALPPKVPSGDILETLRYTVTDGLEHAAYPFPALVRALKINPGHAFSPVFQITYSYQNFMQTTSLKNLTDGSHQSQRVRLLEGIHQEGESDLGLEIYEENDHFVFNMGYNPDLFKKSTVERMMGHYAGLIEEILTNPGRRIAQYRMLTEEERYRLLSLWNGGGAAEEYNQDRRVHELFEEQAQKTPRATALVFAGLPRQEMTYRELNERANQVAHRLKYPGLKAGTMMGLCLERSPDMIVGLLAIFKVGGITVPLEPGYPVERLSYFLRDAGVEIILGQNSTLDKLNKLYKKVPESSEKKHNLQESRGVSPLIFVNLDREKKSISRRSKNNLKRGKTTDLPAYVIYTSGTTGSPKGVLVTHSAIA
ncbi:MAG: AMP-binding protein, partial [bacterium]|nr:AMP-binding protein [bacterium]